MHTQLYLTLCDLMDSVVCQAPLSMGFSRQEYWSEKKKKEILEWVAISFFTKWC